MSPIEIHSMLALAREVEPKIHGVVIEEDGTVVFILPSTIPDRRAAHIISDVGKHLKLHKPYTYDYHVGLDEDEKLWI